MANSKTGLLRNSTFATIDTDPGAGYFCDSVAIADNSSRNLYVTNKGDGVGTALLQFRSRGDTDWIDYVTDEELVAGTRFVIEDRSGQIEYRVGMKTAGYTSGELTVGLDW